MKPEHLRIIATTAAMLAATVVSRTAVGVGAQQSRGQNTPTAGLYAATGAEIAQYDVDAQRASLTLRTSVSVPASVQYGWVHPSGHTLYVVWSGGTSGSSHGVSAFGIEAGTGRLMPRGGPVPLRYRPIHVTTDRAGQYLLIAYNLPPAITVHRLMPDGGIGAEVEQPASLRLGIYLHQVRVDPVSGAVLAVARGNYSEDAATTDPGEIDVLDFADGKLSNRSRIAPNGGVGFNPRHLDFHPTQPWIFVSLEPQNVLQTFTRSVSGRPTASPAFAAPSLPNPNAVRREYRQLAGTVHVHPNGRVLYQANRGTGTVNVDGKRVWAGGFNSIAVFQINGRTGEPTLVQTADTHGLVPRTFAIAPGGRMLVAANQSRMPVRDGATLSTVPPSLATFRILADGRLDYVGKVDLDASGSLFWMNILPIPPVTSDH